MARPGFRQHPKLRRLAHLLNVALPYAWGLCECLWDTAYQSGNPFLGDSVDVELAAEYPGEPGTLTKALLAVNLIDETEPGNYQIHDLHENAPEFVKSRWDKEQERKKEKICEHCGSVYHSGEKHSKFCNATCRVAHFRKVSVTERNGNVTDSNGRVTERNGGVRNCNAHVTQVNGPHSTAQHSTAQEPIPPLPPKGEKRGRAVDALDPLFDRFWEAYPNKVCKVEARRLWDALNVDEPLLAAMLRAISQQKRTDQWQRGKIPKPSNWLDRQQWEDVGIVMEESSKSSAERLAEYKRKREEEEKASEARRKECEEAIAKGGGILDRLRARRQVAQIAGSIGVPASGANSA